MIMADIITKEQRSYNMSRVRSKNTKTEKIIFKMLRVGGYKFKSHHSIIGRPDIAFPKYKIAIFIDGEFWHGKDFDAWKEKLSPFWFKKIYGNIERDKSNISILRKEGWRVLRVWHRDILRNPDRAFLKIVNFIERNSPNL